MDYFKIIKKLRSKLSFFNFFSFPWYELHSRELRDLYLFEFWHYRESLVRWELINLKEKLPLIIITWCKSKFLVKVWIIDTLYQNLNLPCVNIERELSTLGMCFGWKMEIEQLIFEQGSLWCRRPIISSSDLRSMK